METKFKSKKLLLKSQSGHTESSKRSSRTQKQTQKLKNSKTSKSAENAALEIHNH